MFSSTTTNMSRCLFVCLLLVCYAQSRPQLKDKVSATPACEGKDCTPNDSNNAAFQNTFQFVIVDSPVLVVEPKKKPAENKRKNRRSIDDNDHNSLCQSQVRSISPKVGQNKNGVWFSIVGGAGEQQLESFKIQVCINESQPCSDTGSKQLKSVCKQQYVYRNTTALDSDGNVIFEQFRFPSYCTCDLQFK